jgi:hypothetical protein
MRPLRLEKYTENSLSTLSARQGSRLISAPLKACAPCPCVACLPTRFDTRRRALPYVCPPCALVCPPSTGSSSPPHLLHESMVRLSTLACAVLLLACTVMADPATKGRTDGEPGANVEAHCCGMKGLGGASVEVLCHPDQIALGKEFTVNVKYAVDIPRPVSWGGQEGEEGRALVDLACSAGAEGGSVPELLVSAALADVLVVVVGVGCGRWM